MTEPVLGNLPVYPGWRMIGKFCHTRLDDIVIEVERRGDILKGIYAIWSCPIEDFIRSERYSSPWKHVGDIPYDLEPRAVVEQQKIWDDLATSLPERIMELYL